jgi:archaemetzincin
MNQDISKGCDAMMGLTRVDISTAKGEVADWGVLGLAHLGGPSGVVSSFRMKARDRGTRLRRAVKTVNHELGHVIGLDHDDSVAGCVMNDAKGTVRTVDRETGVLCDHERAAIEAKWGVKLPARARIDWAAVMAAP